MTANHNYIVYQREISIIEDHIISSRFIDALHLFKGLMKNYQFIFPRDAYLATQIAGYLNDNEATELFLIQSIKSGCSSKMLRKNLHIRKIINRIGEQNFEKMFLKYHQMHLENVAIKVKEDVLRIYRRDREYLIKYNKLSSFFSRNKILAEWDAFSAVATPKLREIIKKEGFPSYKTIGTEIEEHYDKNDFKDFISSHMAIILLSHDQENITSIMDTLLEEVVKGNLSARGLAFLRDVITYKRIAKKKLKGDQFDSYQYGAFLFLDKENEYLIHNNAERKKIGLCSLETEKEKYNINKRYKRREFWNGGNRKFNSPLFHFLLEDIC